MFCHSVNYSPSKLSFGLMSNSLIVKLITLKISSAMTASCCFLVFTVLNLIPTYIENQWICAKELVPQFLHATMETSHAAIADKSITICIFPLMLCYESTLLLIKTRNFWHVETVFIYWGVWWWRKKNYFCVLRSIFKLKHEDRFKIPDSFLDASSRTVYTHVYMSGWVVVVNWSISKCINIEDQLQFVV